MEEWFNRMKLNPVQLVLIVLGLGFIGWGFWQMIGGVQGEEVVVSNTPEAAANANLMVDVAGAVKQPGVYQLAAGARVGQALEKAGGLADTADKEWIAKMVNMAEPVKDGQKVYIPSTEKIDEKVKGQTTNDKTIQTDMINVNTASQKELESLWGVGEARAQAIINNRPYGSLEELKTKAKLPANILENNLGKISIY